MIETRVQPPLPALSTFSAFSAVRLTIHPKCSIPRPDFRSSRSVAQWPMRRAVDPCPMQVRILPLRLGGQYRSPHRDDQESVSHWRPASAADGVCPAHRRCSRSVVRASTVASRATVPGSNPGESIAVLHGAVGGTWNTARIDPLTDRAVPGSEHYPNGDLTVSEGGYLWTAQCSRCSTPTELDPRLTLSLSISASVAQVAEQSPCKGQAEESTPS